MSYHQWLNGTSTHPNDSATMEDITMRMPDAAVHLDHSSPSTSYQSHHMGSYMSSPSHRDLQATAPTRKPRMSYPDQEKATLGSEGGRPDARRHPTFRLSHIDHPKQTQINMQESIAKGTLADESKYHDAMSRTTQMQWNEQMTKSFLPPSSRDFTQKRLSLAATHPAEYGHQTSKMVAMPPSSSFPTGHGKQVLPPSTIPAEAEFKTMLPPEEPPWRLYTDPKWQTSSDPHFWSNNRTILKSDGSTENGNVVSPTWMVGLPFGSMTEMAESYPCDEH